MSQEHDYTKKRNTCARSNNTNSLYLLPTILVSDDCWIGHSKQTTETVDLLFQLFGNYLQYRQQILVADTTVYTGFLWSSWHLCSPVAILYYFVDRKQRLQYAEDFLVFLFNTTRLLSWLFPKKKHILCIKASIHTSKHKKPQPCYPLNKNNHVCHKQHNSCVNHVREQFAFARSISIALVFSFSIVMYVSLQSNVVSSTSNGDK